MVYLNGTLKGPIILIEYFYEIATILAGEELPPYAFFSICQSDCLALTAAWHGTATKLVTTKQKTNPSERYFSDRKRGGGGAIK